jgi:uncharacterized membrane protein SirB2
MGGRTLRLWWDSQGTTEKAAAENSSGAGKDRSRRALIVVGAVLFFLIPNVITSVGPSWFPAEFLVLLAIFAMGVYSLTGQRAARLRQM